jgi:hypothetical protein
MISRTRVTRPEKAKRFSGNYRAVNKPSSPQGRGLAAPGLAGRDQANGRLSNGEVLLKLIELQELELQQEGPKTGKKADLPVPGLPERIQKLRARIPATVLAHYDYQRARGRLAVASANGYVCRSCFLALPLGSRSVLRAKQELYPCNYCGAYLYLDQAEDRDEAENAY